MSIAQRLVNFSDGLSADGILSAAKGGTGNTTGGGTTSPTISQIAYLGNDTATDPAGGGLITLTGTNFASGAKVLINTTQVSVVTVVSTTQITFTAPQLAAGSYILYVVNLDGSTAIAVPGLQVSGVPAWTTAAGTLGTVYETATVSATVAATSNSAVTYSVFSGTLPTGATLASNGTISGTSVLTNSSTTYTFTIRATDAENQDTDRSFSLTINPDVVSWSSPANGAVLAGAPGVAYSSALVATSVAGQTVSYSANALPTGLAISGATITGTPTTAGSSSTTLTATAANTNRTAQVTISWTITVVGDAYFPYTTLLLNSETTATPFATDASTNNFAVTTFGDTKPNNFNPYTPGYYSNYFDGSGDLLNVPSNAAFTLGTGDFTVECWVYPTAAYAVAPGNAIGGTYIAGSGGSDAYWAWGISVSGNIYIGGRFTTLITSTGTVPLNTWTHIAISRQSGTTRAFINGTLSGTSATVMDFSATSTMYVGAVAPSAGFANWNGYLSNFRVVKGTAVYTAAFTPSTTPLTAITNTSLLTCQSNRFIDNSAAPLTITVAGDTSIKSFTPFVPNTSYSTYGSTYFDGSGDYLSVDPVGGGDLGTADFTIEYWMNASQAGSFIGPVGTQEVAGSATAGMWRCLNRYNSANGIYFAYTAGGTFADLTFTTTNYNDGAWHHVAYVRSSGSLRAYVDGVQVGSAITVTQNLTSGKKLTIGYNPQDNAYYTGYTSNLRIVKGTAVYTGNFTPPSAPLTVVTNTSLLTLQTNQPTNNQTFLDNSSNAFAITRVGNTTQGSFSPYGANWSNYFGSANYISAASNSAFALGTGDFTVEAWVYPTSAYTTYNYVLGVAVTDGLVFYVTGGNLVVRAYGTGDLLSSSTIPALNAWTHIAATRSGTTLRIFVNGVQTASTTNSTNFAQGSAVVGNDGTNAAPWYGYISNLRLVKGTAVYTSAFTPPTTPLTAIANTQLLTCQNSRFVDNSSNAFALTVNGAPTVQRFSPFSTVTQTPQTYSGYFDGAGDYLTFPSNAAFVFGTGDFTIEFWVNQANWNPSGGAYYSHWISINSYLSGIMVRPNTTGTGIQVYVGGTDYLFSTTLSLNTWFHVAVSRSSSSMRVFVNGTQIGATQTVSYNISTNTSNAIGTAVHDTSEEMQGYLSNVRVLKGTALYTSTFTPSTTPLTAIANTSLLTCQSPTFIDNSTNAFAITAVGNTTPRQFNPFGYTTSNSQDYSTTIFGGSAYFDGTGDFLGQDGSAATNFSGVDWAIETWVYISATPTDYTGIIQSKTGTNNWIPYLGIGLMADGRINCSLNGTNNTTTQTITQNTWNHLALVRSSGVVKLYINGVASSVSVTINIVNSNLGYWFGKVDNMDGGGGTNGYLYYFTGYLSNTRFVKGTAVYTSNFVPPTAPLTATAGTTLLLNMDKAAITDSTAKNDLETVGDAKIVSETPYAGSYYSNYFDGTGDYLTVPLSTALALSANYTIECWVYPTVAGIKGIYTSIDASGDPWQGVGFEIYTNNCPRAVGWSGGGSNTMDLLHQTAVVLNTWNHIALCRNNNVTYIYLNGIPSNTSSADSTSYVQSGSTIGNQYPGSSQPYTGYISNLRVVKGTAVYTAAFTPPTTPLTAIANTSLLTCQSKSFVDNSASPLTITKNGDVAVKSFNPFRRNTGSSMFFDGTGDRLQIPASNGIVNFGAGDFTVECWIYLITVPNSSPPILTNDNGFYINFRGNGNIAVTDISTQYAITASALTAGSWFHVAIVRNSGSSKVYVNGIGGTAVACTVNFTNNITTYIGGSPAYVSLNGYIADQRVTKSARYTANFTPPTVALLTK